MNLVLLRRPHNFLERGMEELPLNFHHDSLVHLVADDPTLE